MATNLFFLDTFFIQALLNKHDSYHRQAIAYLSTVHDTAEVWVTEAVLIEVANALSGINRPAAAEFIRQCYDTPNMRVVSVETSLFGRVLDLYAQRPDKTWSLTDCISFVVMAEQKIVDALTGDRRFVQAGYNTLLQEKK